jgi:phage terminase large subunit
MSLFAVNHELYEANSDANYRVFVNQGGTSSGKTYCIMQKLIEISLQEPRCVITVAGQDLPNLKVGALRDTENIIDRSPFLANWFSMNRSESYFRGKNGALIEFKSYDSAQDAKNGKRDYLFVNEANGITFEVYWQLAIRTRKKIYIDYNPSARFWVHDQLLGKEDTKLIISDHRGNEFLTEDEHAKIEAIEDPDWHMVYARGLTGKLTGLVLKKWDIVDKMPEPDTWRMSVYGLDWGFVNDPTALEHLVLAHGELWVDEHIYMTGLTNPEIAAKMSHLNRNDLVVADSAEEKSIAELRNMGLWVIPCTKGKDSIINGLDILNRYQLHFTRRSKGIIEEAKKYKWATDRDGNPANTPIDKFNHAIDAIRYAASAKLATRRQGGAKAKSLSL